MKWKSIMLVAAAVCSSVLVASAQTPSQVGQNKAPNDPFSSAYYVSVPEYSPQETRIGNFYRATGSQSHEEAQLANQAADLARQFGSAKSDTDHDKVKTQLSSILEKQFELRQQRHKKEIESLEAQVKKLRDLVDKRQENRREIINKRLDQILQESQGLGW